MMHIEHILEVEIDLMQVFGDVLQLMMVCTEVKWQKEKFQS